MRATAANRLAQTQLHNRAFIFWLKSHEHNMRCRLEIGVRHADTKTSDMRSKKCCFFCRVWARSEIDIVSAKHATSEF